MLGCPTPIRDVPRAEGPEDIHHGRCLAFCMITESTRKGGVEKQDSWLDIYSMAGTLPECGGLCCKVRWRSALSEGTMKYSWVDLLKFFLQKLKGKPPITSFIAKTNEHWDINCFLQPQYLWHCRGEGLHAVVLQRKSRKCPVELLPSLIFYVHYLWWFANSGCFSSSTVLQALTKYLYRVNKSRSWRIFFFPIAGLKGWPQKWKS